MWKFFAILALAAGSFGLGFYFGQRPAGTLQETAADLQHSLKDTSRNIIDTTMGIERDLRRRQGLIDRRRALADVHFPPEGTSLDALNAFRSDAHRRLIFEEFFFFQLGIVLRRRRSDADRRAAR